MSIQKVTIPSGAVRYRARVKSHGREVATKLFERRSDARTWEQEQSSRIRRGEWVDPRRSKVTLAFVAEAWLTTRESVKRRTRETDRFVWNKYISPTLGQKRLVELTAAQISEWAASIQGRGLSASTARRALATLRAILDHAVADERLIRNPARSVRTPTAKSTREGQALTFDELHRLASECRGTTGEVVLILGYTGLRWGELAGLQCGDVIRKPAPGLRVQRAALSSGGKSWIDTVKNHRARTVPLPDAVADIVVTRARGRDATDWLFPSAANTPLLESNWKRAADWTSAKTKIARPDLRVHDLRHSAASLWLAAGADAKVVQRVLGHATATMTLDLYGHLIDANLWSAVKLVGGNSGAIDEKQSGDRDAE